MPCCLVGPENAELSFSVTTMIDLHIARFPEMPSDIARSILETAAWEDDKTAHILVLLSKVVRQWIDPILYHSVALCTSQQLAAFHDSMVLRSDTAFFSHAVKILCIGNLSSGSLENEKHSFADIWIWTRAVLEVCTGVERLAIWLASHELDLPWLARNSHHIRPTHMSFDVSNHDWNAQPYCVEIFPASLTHLNLDCYNDHDTEDIPWQEIFARCPNLAHISLSGAAIHRSCYKGTLFSLIVSPLMSLLPATVVVFALVVSSYHPKGKDLLEIDIDTISKASDRFVVVCHNSHAQTRGLHVFEKKHLFSSEWGSWRDEDVWDIAQKYVDSRKKISAIQNL